MQMKKHDDHPEFNKEPQPSLTHTAVNSEEMARKTAIGWGVFIGLISAGVAGYWLWSHEIHKPMKVVVTSKSDKAPSESTSASVKKLDEKTPVATLPPFHAPTSSNVTKENLAVIASKEQKKTKVDQSNAKIDSQENELSLDDSGVSPSDITKKNKEVVSIKDVPLGANPESYYYDALKGGPIIYAAPGTKIEVSRDATFRRIYIYGRTNKMGEFQITPPPPGNIYWRVKGGNQAHKITVANPASTDLQFTTPASDLKLGDNLTWSGNKNVSYYKVEISNNEIFSGHIKVLSTKNASVSTNNIGPGSWFIRIVALNLASGTFDYSQVNKVVINPESVNLQNTTPAATTEPIKTPESATTEQASDRASTSEIPAEQATKNEMAPQPVETKVTTATEAAPKEATKPVSPEKNEIQNEIQEEGEATETLPQS